MTAGHVELELRYRVADAAAATRYATARMLGPFRAAGRARQVQVEDRYLDTANGALGRAGYAVRLRRGPTMTVVSVKSTTPAATALHRREELEGPAGLSLDPHAWPPSTARGLVLEHAGDAPLMELVTVRQLRKTRTLADEVAEVELSLDEVAVVAGGRVVDRFVELEVELRRGPDSALDTLAAVLADDPDLEPETATKLERALGAAGAGRAPVRRQRPEPRPADPEPGGLEQSPGWAASTDEPEADPAATPPADPAPLRGRRPIALPRRRPAGRGAAQGRPAGRGRSASRGRSAARPDTDAHSGACRSAAPRRGQDARHHGR